jgi:uncharacterized protein YukJ
MSLQNYGLLTGTLTAHGDQQGGNPHYLLTIQAGSTRYRVAVNLQSTLGADSPPELQYQIIPNLRKGKAKAKALADSIQNHNRFVLAHGEGAPRIDYVHDGFLDMKGFQTIPRGANPAKNVFYTTFAAAAKKALENAGTYVAVFGSGSGGTSLSGPRRASLGFTDVDNVHMNQGTYYEVGHHLDHHYSENGPGQDGAVLFFFSDGTVQGFFSKFQSQDNDTDAAGNPAHTNVPELNSVPAPVARVLTAGVVRRKKTAAAFLAAAKTAAVAAPHLKAGKKAGKKPPKPGKPNPPVGGGEPGPVPTPEPGLTPVGGFVFSDPAGTPDPLHPFQADNDSNVDHNFVNQFAVNGVPEPVPGPRGGQYPIMTLESVIGTTAVNAIQNAGQIVIHMAGDTGAPEAAKLPNEMSVAELMLKDFRIAPSGQPAFYFHLGDVVYYFGEQNYYYDQFYRPYRDYPRPIFAIPGNHDGITYSTQMQSLAPFLSAFADSAPNHWVGAAGISRTTMTQPGVYFTLDAPFVSIIGLYSNCSEFYGYLDQQQTLFLYNELVRLKPLRESGKIAAVLLAVHHPPMSYSAVKPSSQAVRNDIDKACDQASFWPDAIFSGHAHVYQRMTRTVNAAGTSRDIPHLVCGAGGYNINPRQEVDKGDMQLQDTSDPQFRLHRFLANYGYMKLTVTPKSSGKNGTLRVEFFSPNINTGGAADACVLDLKTHALI